MKPPISRKPPTFVPRSHPGSPVDVVDLELERPPIEAPAERQERRGVDELEEDLYPIEVGPISAFGTTEAAEVLASMGPVEFKPRARLDPVIAAAATAIEERRAQTIALEAQRTELIRRGNWKGQCKARDAENGLQCGQLEGHLVASARFKATPHTTARGEFVRCLADGAEASRARELAEWANDRRDVGDVSP